MVWFRFQLDPLLSSASHECYQRQVSSEMGSQWSDVISPQEVATLGALCSLASFTRPELKAKVVENVNMREFLELVPEVRPFHSP